MSYYDYPEYVSVDERKRRNQAAAKRLEKKGHKLHPIILEGNAIAKTFWGKSWCKNIESYQDYAYRLDRGRSYVRQGAVLDLQITQGLITALVQGSERDPYAIRIDIAPLDLEKWDTLRKRCTGRIDSLLALVQGKLPDEILKAFCNHKDGLFPAPAEIKLKCDCPDSAGLCKHLAAVMYGIGARLDQSPELFFLLRGIDQSELLADGAIDSLTGAAPEIDTASLADTFGVDFDSLDEIEVMPVPKPTPVAKPSAKPTPAAKPAPAATKPAAPVVTPAAKPAPAPVVPIAPAAPKPVAAAAKPVVVLKRLSSKDIRELHAALRLTRAQFAAACGVAPVTIVNWEKRRTAPNARGRAALEKLIRQHPDIAPQFAAKKKSPAKKKKRK